MMNQPDNIWHSLCRQGGDQCQPEDIITMPGEWLQISKGSAMSSW